MVPFAGWEMPLHYSTGVLAEHKHCREKASLFDVSHMGQILAPAEAAAALETVIGADILGLPQGRQRYALLTTDEGGIADDLMIARLGGQLLLVVNAANTQADFRAISARVPSAQLLTDRALLALQGPCAEAALARLVPKVGALRFMDAMVAPWRGEALWISRSGYTGEDGFEISLPAERAEAFVCALLAEPEVALAGLGARDSLRLEAGLPLCGADIDATTSPVAAGLAWAIPKVRRAGGARAGGFPGAEAIFAELEQGPTRLRIGLRPVGRAPWRAGTPLFAEEGAEEAIGAVTSGGFSPTLGVPIAMGYVPAARARVGTKLWGELRGQRSAANVVPLPFVPTRYRK